MSNIGKVLDKKIIYELKYIFIFLFNKSENLSNYDITKNIITR